MTDMLLIDYVVVQCHGVTKMRALTLLVTNLSHITPCHKTMWIAVIHYEMYFYLVVLIPFTAILCFRVIDFAAL